MFSIVLCLCSRRLKDQMETPDFKWSTHSLRALDTYDYDKSVSQCVCVCVCV